ncbi:uncharacterized protein LOC117112757 [Anneissia japonica]|uniref:uncharacterized protein LOC117112757 n=1 Tax=Anneissia japonica TaxID=1529436 RepID=UPI0014257551|nr:uncharacterized protein LOC117112757 [Anneissia japonica]
MAVSSRSAYELIDQCSSPVVNRSSITSVKVGKHFVNVVGNGNTLIYFYKQKKRMVIYKLPGKLLCCCIAIINKKKTLICGLEDGKICAINLKDVIKHKKRKHVVKSDSSEDIFAGLLECETAPCVPETNSSNSDDVLELDENSVVLKVKNLVELLIIGSYLFTASTEGDTILISPFQLKATPDDMKEKKDSSCIYFEKLHGSERIFKYQSSPSIDMHQCTKMYCVVSETIATAHQFHKAVVIKDELFNEIFGTEYNILESCMILVGFPDGAIFTLPFKDVGNFTKAQVSTGNCLYNIRQPLASICAIIRDNTHKQQVGDTLVLLGKEGKLLLIGLKKDDVTLRTVFKECYVQEPVQAAVQITSSMLLYSTRKELLQLHFNSQESDREIISDSFSLYDLGITQVVALSEMYYDRSEDDANIGNVFVLTSGGKIGNVQNPDGIVSTTCPDSAGSTGEKIQGLLLAINNLAAEMEAIKNNSHIHNTILLELNKACHVASELTSPNKIHSSLLCDANLQVDAQGTSKQLSVICSVANQNTFTMSFGWSFHIMIIGEHDWFSHSNQPHAVICKSIPLSVFHPGERRELKVNLTVANICLPIDITSAVHFDASNLVEKLNLKETVVTEINLHNSSIIVPVTSLHFDILDVLKPMTLPVAGNSFNTTTTGLFQPKYGSPKASAGTVGWMMESLQSLAKFKPPAKEPVISDNLTINLRFKTINICHLIDSKDGLNYEKFFRWLLPSATNHLPSGALTNQVAMSVISPEGYQVTFTLSIKEETTITLQTKHIQAVCQVVMAVHLKMKNCLQRIQNQDFILEEIHERVKNLKEICDTLEEYKSTRPSSSNVQAPSQHDIQELMQIYIKARSHLT